MEQAINTLINLGIKYGIKLIAAAIILLLGFWITKKITRSFNALMSKRKIHSSLSSFLSSLINITLKILTIIIVLTSVGVEMTSIIAILGAASLAIGMALSGTLQNFAGGVVILILKPFKVGDIIETQDGKIGTVNDIYIFTTRIITEDNKTIYIPNGALANGLIINHTEERTRRLDITVGISYGDDINKVRSLLLQLFNNEPQILKTPAPIVVVTQLDANAVNITSQVWVKTTDYLEMQTNLNELFYNELPKKGIDFPFPQLQVHLNKN